MKFFLLISLFFSQSLFANENLISNGKLDSENFEQFQLVGSKASKISFISEKLTKNACIKIDILRYLETKTGKGFLVGLAIGGARGGDAQNGVKALIVVPGKSYDFSLQLKGTVKKVFISNVFWTGEFKTYSDRKKIKTKLGKVKISQEYQTFSGTFIVPKNYQRAVLFLTIYTNEKYGLTEKPGTFLLIDNISIKEKTP